MSVFSDMDQASIQESIAESVHSSSLTDGLISIGETNQQEGYSNDEDYSDDFGYSDEEFEVDEGSSVGHVVEKQLVSEDEQQVHTEAEESDGTAYTDDFTAGDDSVYTQYSDDFGSIDSVQKIQKASFEETVSPPQMIQRKSRLPIGPKRKKRVILESVPETSTQPPPPQVSALEKKIKDMQLSIEKKDKELNRIRTRDITLLSQKHERAMKRRQEHMKELAKLREDADACKKENVALKKLYEEMQSKLSHAEAQVSMQKGVIEHLENNQTLQSGLISTGAAELAQAKQACIQLEKQHQQVVSELKASHERSLMIKDQAFIDYRTKVETERESFREQALVHAREHEARVDKLQIALDKELVKIEIARKELAKKELDIENKVATLSQQVSSDAKLERNRLEAERAHFTQEKNAYKQYVKDKHSELEIIAQNVRQDEQKVLEQRAQLSMLRQTVETERDKLTAAREEANLARDQAKARREQSDRRMNETLKEMERTQSERLDFEREAKLLFEKQRKIAFQEVEVEREKIEASKLKEYLEVELAKVTRLAIRNTNIDTAEVKQTNKSDTPDENQQVEPQEDNLWDKTYLKDMLDFSPVIL